MWWNPRTEEKNEMKVKRKEADTNTVALVNRHDSLRSFISNSTGGFQFSLVVLLAIARKYFQDNKIRKKTGRDKQKTDKDSAFTFSSREFRDTFSKLACELGLDKYLVRQMAFPEYTITLEYLGFIREKETSGEYEFHLSLDEAKWLAHVGLNEMEFGIGPSPSNEHPWHDTHFLKDNLNINQEVKDLVNEIVLRKSYNEKKRGLESTWLKDVTPRSRSYGRARQHYTTNKQPPTSYKLRNTLSAIERDRLQREIEDETCIGCNRKIPLEDFDIWIGEPTKRTPSNKQDQRMSDILSDPSTILTENTDISDKTSTPNYLNSKLLLTEREILELGYGLLPMDGRDGFIAFAKPLRNCPICGYSVWNTL